MKTVRLPLYEDGLELLAYLEIDVAHFLGAAGSETAHRYMRVVQMPTPEQEKEMIDRIISGLPTRPFFEEFEVPFDQHYYKNEDRTIDSYIEKTAKEKQASAHFRLHENGRVEKLVKQENLEWGPYTPPRIDEWRPIPGFEHYEMNNNRTIVTVQGEDVPIHKGRLDNVLLTGTDGVTKRMSVNHLFSKTFPEL